MDAEINGQGHGKPRCGARRKDGSGGTCRRGAGAGTDHPGVGPCSLHLGSTRNHRIAAERAQLADLAERYSVPRQVHPLDGVMEQYHRYAGQVAYLERRVNELGEDDLFWGVESETDRRNPDEAQDGDRLRTVSAAEFERKSKAGANAKLEQFDKVQAQYAKLGVEIVRIGLETAGDAMASKFAAKLQVMLGELMAECAALAEAQGAAGLADAFRARMVSKVAAFAGADPKVIEGVAA
jgi:hypothetical protein